MDMSLAAARPIRIFLVDGHQIMLWAMQRLIESTGPRMEVAGTAKTLQEMLAKAAATDPDIVVLDLDLEGGAALEAMTGLQQACSSRILALTGSRDPDVHNAAVLRGARGVVGKDESVEVVLQAIDRIHAGDAWVSRHLFSRILGGLAERTRKPAPEAGKIAKLTSRERSIVAAIVRESGAKSLAIAETLGISEHTLRNHLSTIYSKLGLHNRIELYAYATKHRVAEEGMA